MDTTETTQTNHFDINDDGDEVIVRSAARDVASSIGFDETVCEEIAIVATELTTNILVHAGSGEVTVACVTDGDREGIRIETRDAGPGIDDISAAFADGSTTAGSLGGGLGAVNRLMDQVTVADPGEPNYGTYIVATRWLRPVYERTIDCPLSIGAASRPLTPGEANGDTFIISRWDDSALVGVIDGLGHGPAAHEAAMAAKQYVESHFDNDLTSIFAGAERACVGTRGVVMTLARFDWSAGTVTVGAVGNIKAKVTGDGGPSIVQRRGVIGANGPSPQVSTTDWDPTNIFVLFSDGVESHWQWSDFTGSLDASATVIARDLLSQYGKDHDDATVMVVTEREAGEP